jgi:hypothetical protein
VRFKFRCNILISGKIIKEMPGPVSSGTPYIIWVTESRRMELTGHVARVGEMRHVFLCCRIHWKAVTNNPNIRDQETMFGYVSHPRVRECGHVSVLLLGAGGTAVCQACISAGSR